MKDPRNEYEARNHLKRAADAKYRRHEMHRVPNAWLSRQRRRQQVRRRITWSIAGVLLGLFAIGVTEAVLFALKGGGL